MTVWIYTDVRLPLGTMGALPSFPDALLTGTRKAPARHDPN